MIAKAFSILLSSLLSFNLIGAPNKLLINATPIISAQSALLYDLNTETIVYQKNSSQRRPIASLTKLMTIYIILNEHQLDEEVSLKTAHTEIGGSSANLRSNRSYSVLEMIKAALISSANEAALALADHNSGSKKKFVEKMNQYAQKLNLKNTNFQNPMGFDHIQNYSTAYDLAKLSLEIMKNPIIIDIASQESDTITDNNQKKYILTNTNKELNNQLKLQGLKTGTTPDAKQCLIGVTKGQKPVLTIVLNSTDRFLDTNSLIEYTTNF